MKSKTNPLLYVPLYIPVLFVMLFLAIGVINYYYVKKIDRSYTDLISTLLKGDNTIHEVTINSTKTILEISKLINAKSEEERQLNIKNLNKYIENNNTNFKILDSLCNDDFRMKNLGKLIAFRKDFLLSKDNLILMINANENIEKTKGYYRNVVKEKLSLYQDQQMLFAHNAKFVLLENSNALTVLSAKISNITFGLIFAPFVFVLISIFYVAFVLYRNSIYENEL